MTKHTLDEAKMREYARVNALDWPARGKVSAKTKGAVTEHFNAAVKAAQDAHAKREARNRVAYDKAMAGLYEFTVEGAPEPDRTDDMPMQ